MSRAGVEIWEGQTGCGHGYFAERLREHELVAQYIGQDEQTFVAWIDSSNSWIHDAAREEFRVSFVAESILYRIVDETSTGVGRFGRWSGTGKAIILGKYSEWYCTCYKCVTNGAFVPTWTRTTYRVITISPSLSLMLGRVLLVLATLGMFHGDTPPLYWSKHADGCYLQLPSPPMNVSNLDNT